MHAVYLCTYTSDILSLLQYVYVIIIMIYIHGYSLDKSHLKCFRDVVLVSEMLLTFHGSRAHFTEVVVASQAP